MFIAMNRFRVNPERTEEFETLWLERETHLQGLPGFVEFHMLRGPAEEDHVLYASHTIWAFLCLVAMTAFNIDHARSLEGATVLKCTFPKRSKVLSSPQRMSVSQWLSISSFTIVCLDRKSVV